MSEPQPSLLIITASPLELDRLLPALPLRDLSEHAGPWTRAWHARLGPLQLRFQALGIGKARTAAGLAYAIAAARPEAVIQVGIGGAYLGSFLSVGLSLWADEDIELDLGVASGAGWAEDALSLPLLDGGPSAGRVARCHPGWTDTLAALSGIPQGRFATLDAVTHNIDLGGRLQERFGVAIESMEGAAAALVAARLEVPFAQLRVVSNLVGDRDKQRWDIRGALRVAGEALGRTLRALAAEPQQILAATLRPNGPNDLPSEG